jgi:aspartate ammonia-lyase
MSVLENLLASAVATSEMSESDLLFVFSKGERKHYKPGEYLFHEGSPCLWAGIIEDGLVELVRGESNSTALVSVISKGATIAEPAMFGDAGHNVSAFTRTGATVWQVPGEIWQATRLSHPDIYYRLVGRIAIRYRYAADQLPLAKAALLINCDQIMQEGWLTRETLDYILKKEQ